MAFNILLILIPMILLFYSILKILTMCHSIDTITFGILESDARLAFGLFHFLSPVFYTSNFLPHAAGEEVFNSFYVLLKYNILYFIFILSAVILCFRFRCFGADSMLGSNSLAAMHRSKSATTTSSLTSSAPLTTKATVSATASPAATASSTATSLHSDARRTRRAVTPVLHLSIFRIIFLFLSTESSSFATNVSSLPRKLQLSEARTAQPDHVTASSLSRQLQFSYLMDQGTLSSPFWVNYFMSLTADYSGWVNWIPPNPYAISSTYSKIVWPPGPTYLLTATFVGTFNTELNFDYVNLYSCSMAGAAAGVYRSSATAPTSTCNVGGTGSSGWSGTTRPNSSWP